MKIKRLAALLLSAVMGMTLLTGCGDNTSSDNTTTSEAPDITDAVTVELDPIDTEITSLEFTAQIRAGWNLGNTLDATGEGLGSERSWGNPTTTPEMIQAIKDGGFNAVRIPTTWEKHMDENYNIHADWMARVKEIVDYAYERDMYIILNMHHEEWHYPTYDNLETASVRLAACWKQIAEAFIGYDEHLIFEGMNEPRWKNTEWEWNGGNDEGRDVVNQLNKVFVDTVRATGGNNAHRFLMICPYAANCGESALSALEIPDDPRIIVSVHAYIPYGFALATSGGTTRWVSDRPGCTSDIDTLADVLNRLFISKGIAVIIGETGAMVRQMKVDNPEYTEGSDLPEKISIPNNEFRAYWAEYYFGKFSEIGVPCFWWDNGSFVSGETFGLLNRYSCEFEAPEVVEAIMRGADK